MGQWLAVIGCGGLGQLAIRYATAMGYKVIAIDVDDETLQTAKASGAVHAFNSLTSKDFVEKLMEITNGGCHATTVFAAVKAGYDTAPQVLRIGGKLVPVGIAKDDIQLSTFDITMKKFYITAANNAAKPAELKACAEFTAKNNISSPSRFFKLDQINEMIDIMQKEKMGGQRLVVRFDEPEAQPRL
jgi:D-arabinose 1-dehydrogenase-like Zn-dependent alcohol dehydrogenase